MAVEEKIDIARHRFPFCIVWTPLPVLTWIFPLIGHLGIATSKGIIRDFSGSYCVTEDDMGFDWPTMYWQLSADAVEGGAEAYDRAIREASDEYKGRMHNLCCDNCHSHVALALNTMRYGGHDRWNMVKLGFYIQVYGKSGFGGFLKQWGFFIIMCFVFIVLAVVVLRIRGVMVRLTVELIDNAPQFINTVRERELNLRGYKIPVIENMGVTKDQFDVLDLTDNDIKRLDNIPLLKRLHTLYLHNNRVHYIQPDIGEKLPNLKILALTNNNITELGDIDPLANCKKLEYITFIGNPITHKTNYRAYIIYKLPSVRVIDFKRIRLAEREAARKRMIWVSTGQLCIGNCLRMPSKEGAEAYDRAIREASDEYKGRMHNLCCDNCHSHVALALNTMRYGGHDRWNMVKLGFYIQVYGKFTGFGGFLKQWGFFIIMCFVFIVLAVVQLISATVDYSSRLTGGTDPESGDSKMAVEEKIDIARHRFPFCIVWTPLPVL
ncbi:leucine Rich repeat-containing domain protein, partial [Ostertagia ostertagi]